MHVSELIGKLLEIEKKNQEAEIYVSYNDSDEGRCYSSQFEIIEDGNKGVEIKCY